MIIKTIGYRASMLFLGGVFSSMMLPNAHAAIALDRTRAIITGEDKSISLNVSNENKQLPYLAQGWIENGQGEKVSDPFTVLPPVQRIEPGAKAKSKFKHYPVLLNSSR